MYLDRLFKLMAEKQASDLFISCGAPINIKVNGVVQPVSTQPMDVETVRRIAYELMSKEQAREFENEMEMNLSHLDRAVGNFRINIFRQRGTISLVIRFVRSNVPPFEQLKLPSVLLDLVMREARAGPGRRRDRLGQVDDARGDDRPPQLDQAGPHPDHRGPDRVPVRAPPEHRQPARDRRRHAELPPRAAERAARGARPHHDRRDPRQGDDAVGAAAHADRPPVPVDDPREQQLPRAVADHQPVPVRRALGGAVRPVDRPARDHLPAAGHATATASCSRRSRSCSTRR